MFFVEAGTMLYVRADSDLQFGVEGFPGDKLGLSGEALLDCWTARERCFAADRGIEVPPPHQHTTSRNQPTRHNRIYCVRLKGDCSSLRSVCELVGCFSVCVRRVTVARFARCVRS